MKKNIFNFFVLSFGLLAVSPVVALANNEQLTITKICSPMSCDNPDSFPFTVTDSNSIISGSFTLNNSNNYTKTFSDFQHAQTSTNQQPTNNYTITENLPSGWNSPSIDCGGANIGFNTSMPNSVSFDYTPNAMEPLAHIHCNFTNTKQEVSDTGGAGAGGNTDTSGGAGPATGGAGTGSIDAGSGITPLGNEAGGVRDIQSTNKKTNSSILETTTALVSSTNPSSVGQSVTFTATVTSSSSTPTGTVSFWDGKTSLGTFKLNVRGVATFTTTTLSVGNHTITASYNGDSTHSVSFGTTNILWGDYFSPKSREQSDVKQELPQLEGYIGDGNSAQKKPTGLWGRVWGFFTSFFHRKSPTPIPPTPTPQGNGVVLPLKSDLKVRIVVESPAGTYNPIIAPANTVVSVAPTTPATMIKCPASLGVAFLPATSTCSKINVQSSSVKLVALLSIPNATFYKYTDIPVFTSSNTSSIMPSPANGCTSSNPNVLNISCSMFLNGTAVSREIQAVYKCNDTFNYNPNTKQCEKKPVVDLCPNIPGVQTTIPAGMIVDAAGRCVPAPQTLCYKYAPAITNCGVGLSIARGKSGPNNYTVAVSPSALPSISSCVNLGSGPTTTTCSLYYNSYPTSVTLTATSSAGSLPVGFKWIGGGICNGSTSPNCVVNITAPSSISVTASFPQ